MGSKRRNHSPEFKTQVALQALNGQKTLAEIADIYEVHPVQVCQWKQQLVKRLPELYCQASAVRSQEELIQIKESLTKLEVTNGKLNQELDFGFQLQRRRAFNQAKQAILEKKKRCQLKI